MTSREPDDFSQRLQELAPQLSGTLRRIAAHIDRNRADVLSKSAIELARSLDTSDASIIRTARALGYDGLPELKRAIARSVAPGQVAGFQQMLRASDADAAAAARQTIESHRRRFDDWSLDALGSIEAASRMLSECSRIALFGIGPTSHIVGYGAQLLRRHGRRTLTIDRTGSELADQLLSLERGDGMLLFSYGSPYREVETTLDEAARLSLRTVLVTDNQSPLSRRADVTARVPRGSTLGMSLHALTLVWLEATIVAISVMGSEKTTAELEHLERLRRSV